MDVVTFEDNNSPRSIFERIPYLKELIIERMRKNGCNIIADKLEHSKLEENLPSDFGHPFIDQIILFRTFLCPTDKAIETFLEDTDITLEEFINSPYNYYGYYDILENHSMYDLNNDSLSNLGNPNDPITIHSSSRSFFNLTIAKNNNNRLLIQLGEGGDELHESLVPILGEVKLVYPIIETGTFYYICLNNYCNFIGFVDKIIITNVQQYMLKNYIIRMREQISM